MTDAVREHKHVPLHRKQFATDKENDVAAQPITMPKEPPAEIKALIDTVLGGFNNKDSVLSTAPTNDNSP
jgi:hypothetical protein